MKPILKIKEWQEYKKAEQKKQKEDCDMKTCEDELYNLHDASLYDCYFRRIENIIIC